jgi:DNA anti-recombination protein RmuC
MLEQKTLDVDQYLFNLITMFASSAWCQLGKMQDPLSGKVQKDLKSAQHTINMLIMLRDKTRGNLTKKEEDLMNSTISNLQMNYVDETSKPDFEIKEKVESKIQVEEKK